MLMEKCVNDVSIAQLLSYFSGKDDMSLCRDLWAQMIENKISPGPISRALFFRFDTINKLLFFRWNKIKKIIF